MGRCDTERSRCPPLTQQARKLKQLEQVNGWLRKHVTYLSLEERVLKGISEGALLIPDRRRQTVDAAREKYALSKRTACLIVAHCGFYRRSCSRTKPLRVHSSVGEAAK